MLFLAHYRYLVQQAKMQKLKVPKLLTEQQKLWVYSISYNSLLIVLKMTISDSICMSVQTLSDYALHLCTLYIGLNPLS